jgi:hypothetical protein
LQYFLAGVFDYLDGRYLLRLWRLLPPGLQRRPKPVPSRTFTASVTVNADGYWNSEIRDTAFGEVRYNNGITSTSYRYYRAVEYEYWVLVLCVQIL